MNYPKVAVVILNWNGEKHLANFLPSVFNSTYPNMEIIIGDNASTDNSLNFLKNNFPLVKVIINNKNYGFADGYNQVLKQIEADYFVLLNSDVEVTPNWIEPVIKMMEADDKIAIAQPKIRSYYNRDSFEYAGAAGGFIDTFAYPFCRGRLFETIEKDNGQYDDEIEIFWASGCALFIKANIWKEIGGLDEHFFAHMEEIDLCWRAKNIGYKVMYCGFSTVYHVGGGTLQAESPYKTYLNFRNNLYLIKKNEPLSRSIFLIPFRFCLDFLALIKFLVDKKADNAWAISKAHRHFISALFEGKIKNSPISPQQNLTGKYHSSIVFDYFIKSKKFFREIWK
ncbi:glycosyltransferase family 2 protein [Pedobacter glucosidilyticus]|uniref:glycosyltransferase family 2 protein n=1 Tax=Pedobacter glucosidilyticus TaxID=1122941 RepID=UPI0026F2606B|nr:glycosyltransferase family 2 protein [Pedobacter glucosidilyticus]